MRLDKLNVKLKCGKINYRQVDAVSFNYPVRKDDFKVIN